MNPTREECLAGDATFRRLFCGEDWDGNTDAGTPHTSGMIYVRPEDADYLDSPSGPNWPGKPNPEPPAVPKVPFLQKFADIMDGIPEAPGFAPVPRSECAWCRVTKKLAPWLGFVVVGLVVAWLSRKLFRR